MEERLIIDRQMRFDGESTSSGYVFLGGEVEG